LGLDEAGDLDLAQAGGLQRCTNSTLCAVETVCFSFWRPSRGPTSTMVTRFGSMMESSLKPFNRIRKAQVRPGGVHAPHSSLNRKQFATLGHWSPTA